MVEKNTSLSPRDQLFLRMMESKTKEPGDSNVDSDIKDIDSQSNSIKQKVDRLKNANFQKEKFIDERLTKLENSISSISISNKKSIQNKLEKVQKLSVNFDEKLQSTISSVKDTLSKISKDFLGRMSKNKEISFTISQLKELNDTEFKTMKNSIFSLYSKVNISIATSKKINQVTEDAIVGTLKKVKNVLTYSSSVISKTWGFLKNVYGGNKVNKVLKYNPNTISSNIKNFFSFAFKPVTWILRNGTEAVKFIWKGMRTMFLDIPYSVIKKAVNIAGKGIEVFMSWVGDMFLNIFRFPWILFIGIPFLMFVVPKIIDIVWTFLKKNLKMLWDIVDVNLRISEIWNDFIWPTVNNFWKWLTGDMINKWWNKTLPKIKTWMYQFFVWMFGKETIHKFIDGSIKIWNWAKETWNDIVYSYNFLKELFAFLGTRWLLTSVTKLVSIGVRFVKFTYSIAKFIIKTTIRAAKFIARIAWSGLKMLGRGLSRLLPKLAMSLKRFIGPIASAVGRTLKSVGSKILAKIGLKIGLKAGLSAGVRFIPVIGWGIGLIMDTWEIGKAVYYGFRALSARASARESASKWAGKNVENMSNALRVYKAVQAGDYESANYRYMKSAEQMENIGLSPIQIEQSLSADAAYNSMKISSVYYESLWRSLAANAKQDSSAEDYEVKAAEKVADKFNEVFRFIRNYNVRDYESISTSDLKKMLSKTKWALKGTQNIWKNMKTSARKGINSSWLSEPMFTEGIPDAISKYNDIIKMTEQYIAQRENREKAFSANNFHAKNDSRVANTKDIFINPNTLRVFNDLTTNKTPLKNLAPQEHYFANEKLIKAIQFGYQNGPSAKKYVMAGLKYNYNDADFLKWGEKMFMAGVQERSQMSRRNKPLPIFIPDNFSKSDVEKFDKGGIIVPHETENVVLPLNNEGREHIKDQLENINMPEINKIKKENPNITIIEQHTSTEESYEIYAMGQISRGILGVGK